MKGVSSYNTYSPLLITVIVSHPTFKGSPDKTVYNLVSLTWWMLLHPSLFWKMYSPLGFSLIYPTWLQALLNYISLALRQFSLLHVAFHHVSLSMCSYSNMHTLTHSSPVGGCFHLADLASPSTLPHPNQGPTALHSTGQQMLFRWM